MQLYRAEKYCQLLNLLGGTGNMPESICQALLQACIKHCDTVILIMGGAKIDDQRTM